MKRRMIRAALLATLPVHRVDRAGELNQNTITRDFENPAPMAGD